MGDRHSDSSGIQNQQVPASFVAAVIVLYSTITVPISYIIVSYIIGVEGMRTLEEDLQAAREFHGHLCHGMVMGVRMARYACLELGIDDPLQYRDLIVYVEMDRCASDAVSVVTGVTLGRRRLKWVDYGKLAATFVDLGSGNAIRMAPKPDVPHAGSDDDPATFWDDWSDEQLFSCTPVDIDVPLQDRPGRPIRTVVCAKCGEQVQDGRDVEYDGQLLCRSCVGGAYYSTI